MVKLQNSKVLDESIEEESKSGIYILALIYLVGFVSIIFGNWIFKLIGWVTLGLVLLSSIHILKKYKEVNKNG